MTQTKRKYAEFDLAKALVILGLPFVHFLEEAGLQYGFLTESAMSIAESVVFLTIFGPAVFMICMGFNATGNYSHKRLKKTGIQFLIIGYLINFTLFSVSDLISMATGGDGTLHNAFFWLFGADIYVFVGWFYIFFSILKKHKLSDFSMMIVAVGMQILNILSRYYIHMDASIPAQIVGNFISVNETSYFPLLGWAIFPVTGVVIGNRLKHLNAEEYHDAMKKILTLSITVFVSLSVVLATYGINFVDLLISFTDGYKMDFFIVLLLMMIAGFMISLLYFIYHAVRENAVERFLLKISSVIMSFYIIQWLLVALTSDYILRFSGIDEGVIGYAASWLIMLTIWLLSVIISSRWGYSILRVVISKTDYTKWFKKK